jgi:hypothetical protein
VKPAPTLHSCYTHFLFPIIDLLSTDGEEDVLEDEPEGAKEAEVAEGSYDAGELDEWDAQKERVLASEPETGDLAAGVEQVLDFNVCEAEGGLVETTSTPAWSLEVMLDREWGRDIDKVQLALDPREDFLGTVHDCIRKFLLECVVCFGALAKVRVLVLLEPLALDHDENLPFQDIGI